MVYADYAATYSYVKYPSSAYGTFFNPNANYAYKEKRLLFEAENRVKKAIEAKGGKVIFGGTSSQLIENLMNRAKRNTVICSNYEHNSFYRYAYDSVKNISELSENIANMPESYGKMIVMWQGVNNLTGEIFPVKEIGKLCYEHNAFYICDMTAMIGHAPIPANIDQWCDCAVWSGHKLGTELGIGSMWVSDRLDEWLNGFKLHGTPNLAGALAITQAVEDSCNISLLEERQAQWVDLSDELYSRLLDVCADVKQIGNNEGCWTINAIRLPGFNADALQQYLASKQIYVSIGGSACTEKHDYRVLNAYGLSNDEASEVIRVSFGEDSSVEDVETLIEEIKNFKELYIK